MAGINIAGLTKSYALSNKTIPVLQGVNLAVDGDGITVIVGRSGCGKTTLLRVLAGLEQPDKGTMTLPEGRPGMVFQEPRLMPWLTVEANITFGLEKKEKNPETIARFVKMVGLEGFEKAYPRQLSGGMQQRAAIARVLACNPPMLMMDEPFAALDYFTREAMQRELLRIVRESGKAVIFVTHSIEEALILGKRIVVLDGGVIRKEYDLSAYPYPREERQELFQLKKDILGHIGRV